MTFIIILFSLQFYCLSHDTLVYIAHTDCKLFIYRLYSTAVAGVGAIILAATQQLDGCCMSAGGLSVHPYVSLALGCGWFSRHPVVNAPMMRSHHIASSQEQHMNAPAPYLQPI